LLDHIIAAMTSVHVIATMPLDIIVAIDTSVAFVIPLAALLVPSPMEFQCTPKSTPFQSCHLFFCRGL
jgi:hypothetical protein